jgi:exopolysaccharide biosynthesis polyprenyl glycosylphosphotransferase
MKTSVVRKYPWTGWQIALADAVLIWISFLISYYIRYDLQLFRPVGEFYEAPFWPFVPYTFIYIAWMLAANQGAKLYEDRRGRTVVDEFFKMANATTSAAVLVMALSFLIRPLVFSRLMIVQAAFIALALLLLSRLVIRLIRNRLHQRGIGVENVLLVGAGEISRHVIRTIVARPDLGYKLIGFVDDDPERNQKDIGRVAALGHTSEIARLIDAQAVDLVIVTLPSSAQTRILQIIQECERKNVLVRVVPDFFQLNMSQVKVEMLNGLPLLGVRREGGFKRSGLILKRAMDILLTILLLPIAAPLMALTALAIKLDSPGPILFYQSRIGFNGREFKMIKFRSMVQNAEDLQDHYIERTSDDPEGKYERKDDDPRITNVGHFIRRSSLDELPQLFNVLKGEMSLVGPRPALAKEIALYKPWQLQRQMAPPGMTGLWQVSGRSDIPFEEKCLLDIYYIENWSLGLDLQILVQTAAPSVLFGKGAY